MSRGHVFGYLKNFNAGDDRQHNTCYQAIKYQKDCVNIYQSAFVQVDFGD